MNLQLLWIETKNVGKSVLVLLLFTFLYHWATFTKFGTYPFTGDADLLLPYISTRSLSGIFNGVICLPLVLVFLQSQRFKRSARDEFLMALPMSHRFVALHRYCLVIILQLFLFSAMKIAGTVLSHFSTVPGFKIFGMTFMNFSTIQFFTLGIIALFQILSLFLPKWEVVIGWVFGLALCLTVFYMMRQIKNTPEILDSFALPIASFGSALVVLELFLRFRLTIQIKKDEL